MLFICNWIYKVWRNQRGQDLIEYALVAGLVAVGVCGMSPTVATSISTIWSKIASNIELSAAS